MVEGKLRRSCASDHVSLMSQFESESQFGGGRLLVAGEDREKVRRAVVVV
jgi:hypothetical protein